MKEKYNKEKGLKQKTFTCDVEDGTEDKKEKLDFNPLKIEW